MTYFVYWKRSSSAPWTIYECHHGDGAEDKAQACVGELVGFGYAVRLEVNP